MQYAPYEYMNVKEKADYEACVETNKSIFKTALKTYTTTNHLDSPLLVVVNPNDASK